MANEVTTVESIPSYLQPYRPSVAATQEYQVPGGSPLPVLSLEGKVFTVRWKGENDLLRNAEGYNAQWINIIIVQAKQEITKTWYVNPFGDGEKGAPDCFSLDGVKPDPSSPKRQNDVCGPCRWNQWNSAPVGKGKACKDGKVVAFMLENDHDGQWYEGPIMLRIPPDSFGDFRDFVKEQLDADRYPHHIVTRVRFDPQERFRLNFAFARWISEEENDWISYWRDPSRDGFEKVQRILGIEGLDAHGDADAPAMQEEPAQAQAQVQAQAPAKPAPVAQTAPQGPARARPANAATGNAGPQPQPAPAPAPNP